MKRREVLKKIGGVVLSGVLMLSMAALMFVTDGGGKIMTVLANSSSSSSSNSSSNSSSSARPNSGSSSGTTTKDPVETTVEQKIAASIDKDIAKAVAQAASTGQEKGSVKIDGAKLGIHTLSRDTIKQLTNSKVDAVFSFKYKGYNYVITIPAGATPISDDIPWIGPMYLMSLYGSTATVTPVE